MSELFWFWIDGLALIASTMAAERDVPDDWVGWIAAAFWPVTAVWFAIRSARR